MLMFKKAPQEEFPKTVKNAKATRSLGKPVGMPGEGRGRGKPLQAWRVWS